MRPLPAESRRLKVAGLALMALSAPALFYVSEYGGSARSSDELLTGELAVLALVYLVGCNVLALGAIVLLAGFRDLPLLHDARARRGVRDKLVGANLLILLGGAVFVAEEELVETWYGLVALVAALVLFGRAGVRLLRRGWMHDAMPAQALLERDPRSPVVYIRSFAADSQIVAGSRLRRWLTAPLGYLIAISVEQELAMIMSRVGPVVAIGKPGEPLPELGAARLYASDAEWRDAITDLMRRAGLVVVRAGATANLRWEIDRAVELLPRQRLVFVCWAQGDDARAFDADIEQRFGTPNEVAVRESALVRWLARSFVVSRSQWGKIVYFDRDSAPRARRIRAAFSWTGYAMLFVRPYRDPLRAAFRPVFGALGLPWIEQKSRTVAAILALFVGLVGSHHFYLGDRRRGFYYLAFFWTMVPLVLAWVDAVRLVLTSEQDFQRRLAHEQPTG